ncbi:glycosyltransferase [Thermus composti]|uniref:Glycosyltransferase n=1 Tax=Thermus composti TaxID=532059 RepID=A0ABV6Q5L9_9DEIN
MERVYLDLAKAFLTRGLAVDMVLAKAEGPLLRDLPEGINLVDLNVPRRLRLVRAYPALRDYFARRKPKVAIPVWDYVDLVPLWAAWRSQIPCLWVLHNTPSYLRDVRGLKGRVAVWGARKALREALCHPLARVGAVSLGVAEAFARFVGAEPSLIKVLPNPLDRGRIVALAKEEPSELPLDKGEPFLVAVGRLHSQKGFDLLLRAYAFLVKQKPFLEAKLLILGDGPERAKLEALTDLLGLSSRVFFLGYRANPYPYLRLARGLVVSSRYEGLPTVILEALALKKPVVAAESEGGVAEALAWGKLGILVPRTVEGLAQGMEQLLVRGMELPEEELEAHLERYSLESAVRAYLEVMGELWG